MTRIHPGLVVLAVVAALTALLLIIQSTDRNPPQGTDLNPPRSTDRNPQASSATGKLQSCFTPGEDCTTLIVQQINEAKSELLVQAYGFTSASIIQAIAKAKERGVNVEVILDKTNAQKRYSGATYLQNHDIDVLIDDTVAIAHNKVIVIDGKNVITGSFNFTKAAQERNAENILLISDDPNLAKSYADNWKRRAEASRKYSDFHKDPGQ